MVFLPCSTAEGGCILATVDWSPASLLHTSLGVLALSHTVWSRHQYDETGQFPWDLVQTCQLWGLVYLSTFGARIISQPKWGELGVGIVRVQNLRGTGVPRF